jgi:hypothetical protein
MMYAPPSDVLPHLPPVCPACLGLDLVKTKMPAGPLDRKPHPKKLPAGPLDGVLDAITRIFR